MDELEKMRQKLQQAKEKVILLENMVEDRTRKWYNWQKEAEEKTGLLARQMTKEKKEQAEVQLALLNILEDIEFEKKQAILANHNLSIVNKELEQFTYVASHDFQEPLRTITNFVELLNKNLSHNNDDSVALYLKYIVGATSKMQQLIRDLLDFSRIGRSSAFEEVDCNRVMEDVKSLLDLKIKESKAQIRYQQLATIKANEIEMRQLFMNLITNAIKYQKKNNLPEIDISCEEQKENFVFTFTDNGIGIEELYLERIFIIFQRLHKASEYPGTGIGLATCKKIVENHNGKIWVDSKKGEGSSFRFTILK